MNDRSANRAARSHLAELRQLIEHYNHLYYDQDAPVISDYEYDMLQRELAELERQHPEWADAQSPTHSVGGKAARGFIKVRHQVPMQSLTDYFSEAELCDYLQTARKLARDNGASEPVQFVVEQKIDGLSVSLEYADGVLKRASTRGDGLIGEDVTVNIQRLESIPQRLPQAVPYLEVRGEIYMTEADFMALNQQQDQAGQKHFANPRNAAAGSLRQLDPEVTGRRRLGLFIFNIQQLQGKAFTTHHQELDWLRELGLPVIPAEAGIPYHSDAEVLAAIKQIGERRGLLPYGIDGAVVKVDQLRLRDLMGETSKAPRWAAAYKYPPEIKTTRLLKIEVQVGRTGKLTPLAVLEPVLLAGSLISRATLHNEDYIREKDIREGDLVRIVKAGDVIPAVTGIAEGQRPSLRPAFEMPRRCPACGAPVIREVGEAASYCTGSDCPAQLESRLNHFVARDCMDISGLGSGLIKRLMAMGLLNSIADLYRLKLHRSALLQQKGLKDRSVDKLLAAIEQSKTRPLANFIASLGIRHIGLQAAKTLAGQLHSLARIQAADLDQLRSLPDFGDISARSLHSFMKAEVNQKMLDELTELGVRPPEELSPEERATDTPWSGKTIVLTGSFPTLSRSQAGQRLSACGAQVTGTVSSKTDLLIYGDKAGSKFNKALELKIPLQTALDFEQQMNEWVREQEEQAES
ncbi:NAD-dependent DNA ligase LigA [Oscillospiraceae bacterium HV4-5-C5C]|nr:NAD-dependent DNA ligase LigA [Oscillospiraceae bacterium HV4-5-C5C]